jgi:hypothetical protein
MSGTGEVLDCYDEETSYDDEVVLADSTNTSATEFRVVRAATGEMHDGTPSTGVQFTTTNTPEIVDLVETFSSVQDLLFTTNKNSSVEDGAAKTNASGTFIVGCIAHASTNSGSGEAIGFESETGAGDGYIILCATMNGSTFNPGILVGGGTTGYIYNCVTEGGTTGFSRTDAIATYKNCIAVGNTTDWSGTQSNSVNNVSEDATAPGTSSRTDGLFLHFEDPDANDFTLHAHDRVAARNGADLSADGAFAFDDDIAGTTITNWQIGFATVAAVPSARLTGSQENINPYGTGRTYTVLSTWEAATDNNLVTSGQSEVLECYDDETSFDNAITLADTITSGSYFRIIRPATAEGHDGTTNNGVTFSVTGQFFATVTEDYVSLQDLIVTGANNTTNEQFLVDADNTQLRAIGMLIYDAANSGSGTYGGFATSNPSGGINVFALCLADNTDDHGFNANRDNGVNSETAVVLNCVSANNGDDNFRGRSNVTWEIRNCIGDNPTSEDFDDAVGVWNITYCASSDGTATGTGSRTTQSFSFVSASDFHLQSGDGGAKDFGTSLLTDTYFPFTDDIDGADFVTWDIGFDEPSTAATYEQEGYRWRDDDGTETTATWAAAQDTSTGITISIGTNIRLRMLVNTTNDAPSQGYELQHRIKDGPAVWRKVST